MAKRLDYGWRVLGTGLSFAVFGIGGLILTLFVFPALYLLPGSADTRRHRTQWLIHKTFAAHIWFMQAVGIMRLHTHGIEALRDAGPQLVLANHPTYVDVVALISRMPAANCVVKSALWYNPFMGGVVRAARYIANDDSDGLIDDCAASLDTGLPLIIFPEGTRSVPGQPMRFVRGAAHIALRAQAPILPVVIHCDPPTLTKGSKWYQIPPRPFQLTLSVRPPLAIGDFIDPNDPPGIAARKLTEGLQQYFTRELEVYGPATA